MVGVGPTEDIRGTNATKIESVPNGFVIKGLYGGMKPSVKKYSSKLESWDVQIDSLLYLGY